MPGEDVVTAVDVLAIDREATTRDDGEDSFDNKHGCDVTTLFFTLICDSGVPETITRSKTFV